MNSEYLQHLLGFHYWARDRVMLALEPLTLDQYAKPMGNSFSSIRDTMNHIYHAEWIWLRRWNGESPTAFPGDAMPDLASLRTQWTALEEQVRAYLDDAAISGLDRVIEYKLMSGKPGASPIWQMFAHVVNHASYHRGQVTTMIRQIGAVPAQSTDMITYFRELRVTAKTL